MKQIVLAVTGASGAAYARELARALIDSGNSVHLLVSPHGTQLLKAELGSASGADLVTGAGESLRLHDHDNLADPLASGNAPTDAMVICPASCNTVASIAAGLGANLIDRAAHIHLKQRRPLIIVPRETPLTVIDLENQLRLARAGAIIAPASPGFYTAPKTIDELVDFMVARILDLLGITHGLPSYDPSA